MKGESLRGNFISEWFGYRTYPIVHEGATALQVRREGRCPFLTAVTRDSQDCVKASSSSGVCTINNASNGSRQDWLVCPYRALDPDLIEAVVRRLFEAKPGQSVMAIPASAITRQEVRDDLLDHAESGGVTVVYLQNRLGGEISVKATARSPELSFDVTLVEMVRTDRRSAGIGRFGVLEIQTMDFHGSYRHAVKNLKDSLRLHGPEFPEVLQKNQQWLSERIEGPNIANVFKRTFYQMMLKFQIGVHPRSVGTSLAVPHAVWESWQPHLGRPDLVPRDDGTHALRHPAVDDASVRAWIYVFDIDTVSGAHPSPIMVRQTIATDTASTARYALEEVPNHAFSDTGAAGTIVAAIHRRLSEWWPELASDLRKR